MYLRVDRTLSLVVCSMAIAACSRLQESQLVGTWQRRTEISMKVTFLADHSLQLYVAEGNKTEFGTWQLSGNTLTTIIRPLVPSVGEHGDGSMREVSQIEIRGHQLFMTQLHSSKAVIFERTN
jgi:hypothetical protein